MTCQAEDRYPSRPCAIPTLHLAPQATPLPPTPPHPGTRTRSVNQLLGAALRALPLAAVLYHHGALFVQLRTT